MKTKQKAITPIVATILLVVVSVILVTIVLNWGKDFSNKSLATTDTEKLSKSDASEFVYTKAFSDGVIQFNYAPPDSLTSQNIIITGYKIFSDNNETAEIILDSNYTLSQGLNIIPLTDFSDQNITSRKMNIELKTSDGEYIMLNNVINPEPYVAPPYVPQQYTAGPYNPGTMADDNSIGDFAWSNPNNALTSNNVYSTRAVLSIGDIGGVYDLEVKIVKSNGTIGSTNKAELGVDWLEDDTNISYGDTNDLWGETWASSDINDSDFGVVLQTRLINEGPSVDSHYIKATNFNFDIPTGATITGILVNIEKSTNITGNPMDGITVTALVDNINITVYYTI